MATTDTLTVVGDYMGPFQQVLFFTQHPPPILEIIPAIRAIINICLTVQRHNFQHQGHLIYYNDFNGER
jgi:hypothetical protein